jgi:hypothetical protein
MNDQQREGLAIVWRTAFASGLNASASYRRPAPDSFGQHFFDWMTLAAEIADLNVHAEAEELRRQLRAKFGPFARLTPDWWTVRRFERQFAGASPNPEQKTAPQ